MAKSYYEKLKDPRWQKKRLQILERDNFKCVHCQDDKETLHIHHIQYKRASSPWDYPNNYLITLCKTCHEEEELYSDNLSDRVVDLYNLGLDNGDLALLLQCLHDLYLNAMSVGLQGKLEQELIQRACSDVGLNDIL